uniref:RING-type domain-containing protein n=1 Tax=Strigops habroptila TaxID=2489341 RepID=A0A672V4U4_STRHB
MDSQPQPVESVAMELEDRCPICLGSWEEASYVTPCLHQFCYECILRWWSMPPPCQCPKKRHLDNALPVMQLDSMIIGGPCQLEIHHSTTFRYYQINIVWFSPITLFFTIINI